MEQNVMDKSIGETKKQEDAKKLSFVVVFLSMFVIVLFGLVPLV